MNRRHILLASPAILPMLGEPDVQRLDMVCDGATGCRGSVRRAPRIAVPSRTPLALLHRPVRLMTELHYCEAHRDAFSIAGYWTPTSKRRVELFAKLHRPQDWKPDFEAATVELVLTTTPEYRAFLERLGVKRVVT